MPTIQEIRTAPLSAKIGMSVIALYIGVAVFAPLLAPYGETQVVGDVWEAFRVSAPLGTDQLGRDVLTRLLYGAQNTVSIALVTTVLAFAIGVVAGLSAAIISSWLDTLLCWLVDILMAIPTLIFALMLLSVLGTSIPTLILVIGVLSATRVFRLSRAVAMDVTVMEFVEVAKLRGEGWWWILRQEILPNTLAPLVAEFGLRFCFVFLFISSLSFLGLGIQPPTADWGSMVRENAGAIPFGLPTPFLPAAAIAVLTIGVNLVVDWFLQKASGLRGEE